MSLLMRFYQPDDYSPSDLLQDLNFMFYYINLLWMWGIIK